MGDYVSVIRRRKLLIAAMTLAGLALALFYSVAVAKPSYVSHAKVLVRPITTDVTPQALDKLIVMGTEREIATSTDVATIAKDRMKSTAPVDRLQQEGDGQRGRYHAVPRRRLQRQDEARRPDAAPRPSPTPTCSCKTHDATKNRDARIANANAALNPINAQIVEATKRLAAAAVGSPAQAEAESTLRSLQDQGAPYRQVLADMAKLNVNDAGTRRQRRQPPRRPGQPQAQDQRRPGLLLRPLPRPAGGLRPGPGRQPSPGSGRPRGVPAGPRAGHGAPHPAQRPHRSDAGHHAAPEQPRLRGLPGPADPGAGHGRAPGPEDDHGRLAPPAKTASPPSPPTWPCRWPRSASGSCSSPPTCGVPRSTSTSASTTSVVSPTSSPARCRRGRPCRSRPVSSASGCSGRGPVPAQPAELLQSRPHARAPRRAPQGGRLRDHRSPRRPQRLRLPGPRPPRRRHPRGGRRQAHRPRRGRAGPDPVRAGRRPGRRRRDEQRRLDSAKFTLTTKQLGSRPGQSTGPRRVPARSPLSRRLGEPGVLKLAFLTAPCQRRGTPEGAIAVPTTNWRSSPRYPLGEERQFQPSGTCRSGSVLSGRLAG